MSILKSRLIYKPFEYPAASDFWLLQQQSHWLFTEVPMLSDITDFKQNLNDSERNVIANVLKLFTQTEVLVNDYWTNRVTQWFPKPEIVMMATTFGAFESIHQQAYAYLNDSLGLDDYEAFLHEVTMKTKIDSLIDIPVKSKKLEDIALSLALFSAFTEGVALFSSFAILMSFEQRNLLKGVGNIVEWSLRDEVIHSDGGCWLFNTLIEEHPEIYTDELKQKIYQAARDVIRQEDAYIDKVFELGDLENLDPKDLKEFIRYRANNKLGQIGLKQNWKNIDMERVNRLGWFDVMTGGETHTDFFARRVSNYSKGHIDFSTIWE